MKKTWNVITHLTNTVGFGSQKDLADAIDCSRGLITKMKQDNSVPSNRQVQIILAGRELGLNVVPNDFFPPDLRSASETQDQAKA